MSTDTFIDVKVARDEILPTPKPSADPFDKAWKDIKSESVNLDNNLKRRVDRLEKSLGAAPTASYEESSKMQPSGSGAQSNQINPGKLNYVNGYGAFDAINPPYNLYTLAGFYDTSFSNHSAISAKVHSAVGMEFSFQLTPKAMQELQTKKPEAQDKAKKKLDKIKVAAREWLEGLNDQDAFTDTMNKIVTDYEATGNGYMEIGRTTTGKIGYVGHVPAITVRVRRLKDGYVQIIGQKVVYFRNFGAKNPDPIIGDPEPNEIIHFKKYSPLNTYYGVPDVVSAATSVVGDQQAEQYNLEYFENKAVPRYLITLKGAKLSATAEDKLFRFLQTNLKGQNHRTLFVPLPPDADGNKVEFKMEPVENKIQDASFEQYRQNNRQNILMAHQVPLSKLGIAEGSGVAAAVTQDRTFRDNVIRPLQRYLEKVVSNIIKEATLLVELKFNEASVVDELVSAQIHEIYLGQNVIKPNEVRGDLGKAQIEGLDDEQANQAKEQMQMQLDAKAQENQMKADTAATAAQAKAEAVAAKPAVAGAKPARDARDRSRSQNASDSPTTATGRNPKGSGAKANK
jgi:PBSX family phage portal protein